MGRPPEISMEEFTRVIVVMVHELNVKKEPYISASKIADLTKISKRSVMRRLERLEGWGVVKAVRPQDPKSNKAHLWTLMPQNNWAGQFAVTEEHVAAR